MNRTSLIRLGGFAAIVGGVAYTLGTLVCFLQQYCYTPWGGSTVALTLGAMAAIAALHALQREHYGLPGALASLTAFAGAVLFLVGGLESGVGIAGASVATVSLVVLGILTITAGALPWWCGASLIVGSPLLVFFFGTLVTGVAWVLVGFAVFRAATRLPEQPSRVR